MAAELDGASIAVLIPARMESTRLPGKPLAPIAGKPMIAHVMDRARESGIGRVAVATDSPRIAEAVEAHGGEAIPTGSDCASGSDRVFEAARKIDPHGALDAIINLQGDLPTIPGSMIASAALALLRAEADIATLAAPIRGEELDDPDVVKLFGFPLEGDSVDGDSLRRREAAPQERDSGDEGLREGDSVDGDSQGDLPRRGSGFLRASGFSRAAPPQWNGPLFHHVGIYAWRPRALERFVSLPPSPQERRERLEQLRALEDGMLIDAALVDFAPPGVDTQADLERARAILENRRGRRKGGGDSK